MKEVVEEDRPSTAHRRRCLSLKTSFHVMSERASLLGLPVELRCQIYGYIFAAKSYESLSHTFTVADSAGFGHVRDACSPRQLTAIFLACKQTHFEAIEVFWDSRNLTFRFGDGYSVFGPKESTSTINDFTFWPLLRSISLAFEFRDQVDLAALCRNVDALLLALDYGRHLRRLTIYLLGPDILEFWDVKYGVFFDKLSLLRVCGSVTVQTDEPYELTVMNLYDRDWFSRASFEQLVCYAYRRVMLWGYIRRLRRDIPVKSSRLGMGPTRPE